MIQYHDEEWGVPLHDDRGLFELFTLECFQAGLNWTTILNKREHFRAAFDYFDYQRIAAYDQAKVDALLGDARLVRNRLKVAATVNNARALLRIQEEYGSFDRYIWQFTGGKPRVNAWKRESEIPGVSPLSLEMSRDLKRRGFQFAGPTISYAFMQAAGMVNDHVVDCFCYARLTKL